jgi:hypothetical protein
MEERDGARAAAEQAEAWAAAASQDAAANSQQLTETRAALSARGSALFEATLENQRMQVMFSWTRLPSWSFTVYIGAGASVALCLLRKDKIASDAKHGL